MRFALVVVAAFAVVAATVASPPARAEERVRVALLPVVVHASEGREYLQRGLTDMLVSRLGRERRIAVIPVEDANTATTDVAAARKVGAANDAEAVVFGSLTRFGDGASLDLSVASVRDTAREPRKIYVHAETMGALIPLLDGVAERTAFAALGGNEADTAVAAGPQAGDAANASEFQELRRRVEALERAVYDAGTAAKKTPTDTDVEITNKRGAPGSPASRGAPH